MSGPVQWLRWRGILVLAALTPPCRQITQLASRAYDRPLTFWTRLRLRVHLGICDACERYLRQIDFLHEASAKLGSPLAGEPQARMATEAKERIKARLRCERVGQR
ncbi:MAG TPA: zf-HC2 domain-containing protein [Candidatus Limnocylindria bacterium]|jgi:hypothetical protein|nr:zf-HC2 domain-containing protein [Candidatus Limnocylindria bacterium]